VSKTKAFRRIGPKTLPGGNPENGGPKNPYKQAIKNPKHYRLTSCICDGYLTMRGFEVAISLELKTRQMHFLKGPKKRKIHPKNRGLWEQRRKILAAGNARKRGLKNPDIQAI
jgi:hypothetical protein